MTNLSKTEQENLVQAKDILRALSHKLRVKILAYISENTGTTVKPIYKHLKVEQSVVSQHLSILRDIKVLETQRNGKQIKYFVNYKRLDEIVQHVETFAK